MRAWRRRQLHKLRAGSEAGFSRFDHHLFGVNIGGGKINNPGRYLVLLPPINGATAASGTPCFTENPGDRL
jgi:hypothetical protein